MRKRWTLLGALILSAVAVAAVLLTHRGLPDIPGFPSPRAAFPELDRSTLSEPQLRVLDIARTQYDAQPGGKTYSEGIEEPWCADFVSWVLNAAGEPLVNPNSGGWRIPGVFTMAEYFQSVGRFVTPDVTPRPGDVVLWGAASPMGEHANFVVSVGASDDSDDSDHGTVLTTVGGNEGGIAVRSHTVGPDTGLLGYGRLT